MTAEQLLASDIAERRTSSESGMVALIRSSFDRVAPQTEALGRHFYATLFSTAPATRDLFPVNMEV
jgi:hemoglobin-like flavoprotein